MRRVHSQTLRRRQQHALLVALVSHPHRDRLSAQLAWIAQQDIQAQRVDNALLVKVDTTAKQVAPVSSVKQGRTPTLLRKPLDAFLVALVCLPLRDRLGARIAHQDIQVRKVDYALLVRVATTVKLAASVRNVRLGHSQQWRQLNAHCALLVCHPLPVPLAV